MDFLFEIWFHCLQRILLFIVILDFFWQFVADLDALFRNSYSVGSIATQRFACKKSLCIMICNNKRFIEILHYID